MVGVVDPGELFGSSMQCCCDLGKFNFKSYMIDVHITNKVMFSLLFSLSDLLDDVSTWNT